MPHQVGEPHSYLAQGTTQQGSGQVDVVFQALESDWGWRQLVHGIPWVLLAGTDTLPAVGEVTNRSCATCSPSSPLARLACLCPQV